jgi:hypothetical protein
MQRIDPQGERRMDLRFAAAFARLAAAVHPGTTYSWADFMPDFDPKPAKPEPVQTLEEMKAIFGQLKA